MHILALLVTMIVGISVWWWRLKAIKNAGETVIDAADRFRGARRRAKMARETSYSPITAIEHPATAAATYIQLIVGREVWPMAHGRVKARLAELAGETAAEEAVTYAEWVVRQPLEPRRSIKMLTAMLREHLTLEEREDLAAMLKDAAQSGGQAIQAEASRQAIDLVN